MLAASAVLTLGAGAARADLFDDIGYTALIARLGAANVPTGASVGVGQVEAPAGGSYGPDQADPQFAGKVFMAMSGPPGNSFHANTVAWSYYGDTYSTSGGVTNVWLWDANGWLTTGYLNAQGPASLAPLLPPGNLRMFNNSWVGTTGVNSQDNTALRRMDFAIRRDDTLCFNGMNNAGGGNVALMANGYNGVSVGRTDGGHVTGPTPVGVDGPGRQKPEIVAPGSATSFTTPIVASAAALLIDTAVTDAALVLNPNADHSTVIKSVLLAGGLHRPTWSNNPAAAGANRGVTSTPLDPVYGVDTVNVDRSHMILTGGEFDGTDALATAPMVDETGWDLASVANGQSRWWKFTVNQPATTVGVLATWHRIVPSNFGTPTVANFDLRLWRIDSNGIAQTLVGDPGLPYFAGGNVVSQSAIDNVEHVFVKGLQPGTYAIELDRIDASAVAVNAGVSWIRPDDPDPSTFGDLTGDGIVDGADLGILLGAWGTSGPGDLNGDGTVDGADLGLMLGSWS